MKMGIFAAALALIATGSIAAPPDDEAAEQVSTAAATDAEAAEQEEKKICRTEKATGSLTRRNRICMTQAQWREVHDRTRRGVSEMNSAASGGKECILDQFGGCR